MRIPVEDWEEDMIKFNWGTSQNKVEKEKGTKGTNISTNMRSKSEEIRVHANEWMLRQRLMNGEHSVLWMGNIPLDKPRLESPD